MKTFLLFFLLFSSSAFANEECEQAIQKLCANETEKFGECLQKNKDKLPPACRKDVTNLDNMAKDVGANCLEDIMKHCPINMDAVEKDPQAVVKTQAQCFQKSKSKFSPSCQKVLDQISKSTGVKGGSSATIR